MSDLRPVFEQAEALRLPESYSALEIDLHFLRWQHDLMAGVMTFCVKIRSEKAFWESWDVWAECRLQIIALEMRRAYEGVGQ